MENSLYGIECRTLNSQNPLEDSVVIDDDIDSDTAASQKASSRMNKYVPQNHLHKNTSQRDYLYTLVMNLNRLKLRNHTKDEYVPRCGFKNDIVCILQNHANTFTDTLRVRQRRLWCNHLRANTALFVVPTVEKLSAHATAAACSSGPPSRATHALTANEFSSPAAVLLEI